MTVPGRRPQRLGQRILEEISELLLGELKDPRIGFATITGVRVTPDLRQAVVSVSILGSEKERKQTLQGLEAAKPFIRHELAERLDIRRAPDVVFKLDLTAERAARVEELLRKGRLEHDPGEGKTPDENG